MVKPVYLTPEGDEKLRKELAQLKGPKRQEIADRLRVAISQGDLSENADYIGTKEEQGFVEGRIQEIEALIRNAVLIENGNGGDEVALGTHVTIKEGTFPEERYHLVGPNEANPREGRISHESPIGKAIYGKRVGDEVTVKVPNGQMKIKIIKIE